MDTVVILVKWPKTNIIFILFYLLDTPYEIWIQTTQLFLRKLCLDTYAAVQNEWPWMICQRVKLTFGVD